MSHAAAAATLSTGTDQDVDDDDDVVCPICLEDLPKLTWRGSGRTRFLCCGKAVCHQCAKGLPGTFYHNALQEGARLGVPPTSDQIVGIYKEKEECPFCRSSAVVSDSEAVQKVQALADRGKPWASTMLGMMHGDGLGTEKNQTLALECFRKAAEMGCTLGQRFLGECYLLGVGTAVDVDEAAVWFERAAAAGFAVAQYLLGKILSGFGGPSSALINQERAAEMYAEAAGQGYGPAQSEYDHGLGVPPSLELAIFWGRKAAVQGIASAQMSLAGCYVRLGLTGFGVMATVPIALFWSRKAAAAGDPVAIPLLRHLEKLTANRCSFCSASGSTLSCRMLRCSRCKGGLYCSVEHQKKHWKVHKRWCEEVKAASEEYEQAQKDPISTPGSVYVWPNGEAPVRLDSESAYCSSVSQTVEHLVQSWWQRR